MGRRVGVEYTARLSAGYEELADLAGALAILESDVAGLDEVLHGSLGHIDHRQVRYYERDSMDENARTVALRTMLRSASMVAACDALAENHEPNRKAFLAVLDPALYLLADAELDAPLYSAISTLHFAAKDARADDLPATMAGLDVLCSALAGHLGKVA